VHDMTATELTVLDLVREVRLLKRDVAELTGERRRLVLENTGAADRGVAGQTGSSAMVALQRFRSSSDYCVVVEVEGSEGGSVGDIVISGKCRNGFRIACTGDAARVFLNLWVTGISNHL